MFSDALECYQAIGSALTKAIPEQWESIRVEIVLDGNRIDSVVVYEKPADAGTGHVAGVPMLARYFYELARLVSTEEKGLFQRCVFTLAANGQYDVQFTY